MKQYQFTLSVPDDFNPEELAIELNYKDGIQITNEGFLNEQYSEAIDSLIQSASIEKKSGDKNEVVLVKFPRDNVNNPEFGVVLDMLMQRLEEVLDCPVICYVDDLEILVENADQAIDMFNGMIAKIKVRAAVKETSKIILT